MVSWQTSNHSFSLGRAIVCPYALFLWSRILPHILVPMRLIFSMITFHFFHKKLQNLPLWFVNVLASIIFSSYQEFGLFNHFFVIVTHCLPMHQLVDKVVRVILGWTHIRWLIFFPFPCPPLPHLLHLSYHHVINIIWLEPWVFLLENFNVVMGASPSPTVICFHYYSIVLWKTWQAWIFASFLWLFFIKNCFHFCLCLWDCLALCFFLI
jgi:hypothetical protein